MGVGADADAGACVGDAGGSGDASEAVFLNSVEGMTVAACAWACLLRRIISETDSFSGTIMLLSSSSSSSCAVDADFLRPAPAAPPRCFPVKGVAVAPMLRGSVTAALSPAARPPLNPLLPTMAAGDAVVVGGILLRLTADGRTGDGGMSEPHTPIHTYGTYLLDTTFGARG